MEHPSKGRTGNKIRTCLLYAIGEILLASVGEIQALMIASSGAILVAVLTAVFFGMRWIQVRA